MSDSCCIFGAGPFYGLPKPLPADAFLIAADGGYVHCQACGLTPHLLLGDFDSLDRLPPEVPRQTFPPEKDDTDMMLAVKAGLHRGCRTFHLYGGTGGRLDHTLGNVQVLLYLACHGARGYLYDEAFVFTALRDGTLSLPARQDGLISVFCLGPDAQGVCLRGLRYPLEDAPLSAAFPLGVSNRFTGQPVEISVAHGSLLVGWQLDPSKAL